MSEFWIMTKILIKKEFNATKIAIASNIIDRKL